MFCLIDGNLMCTSLSCRKVGSKFVCPCWCLCFDPLNCTCESWSYLMCGWMIYCHRSYVSIWTFKIFISQNQQYKVFPCLKLMYIRMQPKGQPITNLISCSPWHVHWSQPMTNPRAGATSASHKGNTRQKLRSVQNIIWRIQWQNIDHPSLFGAILDGKKKETEPEWSVVPAQPYLTVYSTTWNEHDLTKFLVHWAPL